ncbi:hypothetical protein V1225_05105 [Emergencia sp. JLR.KK010]|uniref:hypothetical protein n=1 Tax=Emergencia sp. JLR.KK010 TaxID=3114296 RepID=UPI0030D22420
MFDIEAYREHLYQLVAEQKISRLTADGYVGCLERLDEKIRPDQGIAEVIRELCKNTQQGGKYIAAVKKYERDILDAPKSLLYGQELFDLRKQCKQAPIGREPVLPEQTYLRKINRLNNETVRVALRLQVRSGLRIAEIGDLRAADIEITEDGIKLFVRCGKGRKSRHVDAIKDVFLETHLKELLEGKSGDDRAFDYSTAYLKKKANALGIPTHDLRRINSRMRYRQQRGNGFGRREARRQVQKQLGHAQAATTSAYLGKEWSE